MKLEECIKRIERYMHSTDSHPRLVNVKNQEDMKEICTYFKVGTNIFKDVSDYARSDENPSEAALFEDLRILSGTIFVTGFTTFYKLYGEQKIKELLKKLVTQTNAKLHVIILCYQSESFLDFADIRYDNWVYYVDGKQSKNPKLVFVAPEMTVLETVQCIDEIQNFSLYVEQTNCEVLYIRTTKRKSNYIKSLFDISEQNNAFDLLIQLDPTTNILQESYGNDTHWKRAILEMKNLSWTEYIKNKFGTIETLHLLMPYWNDKNEYEKWLYFIALKLFGAPSNKYLNKAIKYVDSVNDLIKSIYQMILKIPYSDEDFWEMYDERKKLLKKIGFKDTQQINDYCDWVQEKESKTLYYLTDMSEKEIKLIFKIIDLYSEEYSKQELLTILKHVFYDLYLYLNTYDYKNTLLNNYFEEYKYQKVTNKISSDFLNIVEQQAIEREYLRILPSRCEKTESIEMTNTAVYFIDAMGVEYMAYIMALCREYNLMSYTTLCHCEIPSITSKNKDFIEVFEKNGGIFIPDKNGVKNLDDMKHHGTKEFDFGNNQLPSYLYDELMVIRKIFEEVNSKLQQYDRVVLISDHGASRLSVISKKENKYEMKENGKHSGRCCPKSESDEKPLCVIDGEDYWVLANYDRFKGSRPANIEVHGGATLEEVVIPIIEITKPSVSYEFKISTPKIQYSKRKQDAVIKIYSKTKLDEIAVLISGMDYKIKACSNDGHNFIVSLPNLKSSMEPYRVDIYIQDNLVKEGLSFIAENKDFKERKLL